MFYDEIVFQFVQIRHKPSHQRSVEEKQWFALDMLINTTLQESLSVVEREEIHLNDEYKTILQAEDVTRILELPHEIQLCLPHLNSPAEVEAHRLLTTYTHEHGDAEFAKADEYSQDEQFTLNSSTTNAIGFAPRVSPDIQRCSYITVMI